MTNLRELFDEATTAAPPCRLSVEDVFSVRRSQRRRRHLQSGLVAVVLAAVAAGVVFKVDFTGHPPAGAAPPGPVVWAGRGDAMHLYVVKNVCGQNPYYTASPDAPSSPAASGMDCHELLASSDGGATWLSRGAAAEPPRVLGPLTLMRYAGAAAGTPSAVPTDPSLSFDLSTDGGITWSRLPGEGAPVEAVPAGGALVEGFGRALMVFDPAQGRLRKLMHPPALRLGLGDTAVVGSKDIWLSGLNPATLRPAVAVSHDGGATWTQRDLPGTAVVPQPTLSNGELDPNSSTGQPLQLIAHGGTIAYATMWDGSPEPTPAPQIPGTEGYGWLRTYHTTDGGLTWQAVSAMSTTPSYAWAWTTADGRIVVGLPGRNGSGTDTYAMGTDGIAYAPAAPPGLPTSLIAIDGSIAFSDHAAYTSDDGWNWREVWHD